MNFYKVTLKLLIKDENGSEATKKVVIFVEAPDYTMAELEARNWGKQNSHQAAVLTVTKTKVEYLRLEDVTGMYYEVKTISIDLETEREYPSLFLVQDASFEEVVSSMKAHLEEGSSLTSVVLTPAVDVIQGKSQMEAVLEKVEE